MKVEFEKVIDGINKYIDKEICSGLNELQDIAVRFTIGRLNESADNFKQFLMSNGFVKTLCIIDDEGMVDIDRLLRDIKKEIDRKGSLSVKIPLIGKLTFTAPDVDVLHDLIIEG